MPRTQKDPHSREIEDAEADAPRIDESDVDRNDGDGGRDGDGDGDGDTADDDGWDADWDEDDIVEEIRIEELTAMEGPDA